MSAANATAPAAPAGFRIDPRYLQAGLASTILILSEYFYQILGGYDRFVVALATAIAAEAVCGRLSRGFWPNVVSGYISGVSIVILTKPSNVLWPFVVGSLISIVSKYAIQWKGRHIFNPTNFGLCVMLMVASDKVALLGTQWGNSFGIIALIWSWGLLVVWRARVIDLTLTYLFCFIPLAWLRASLTGDPFLSEIAPLTGPMQTLFMFFMITDPPTVMSRRSHRIFVVILIALLECFFRLKNYFGIQGFQLFEQGPSIAALFFVGPVAKWIDLQYLGGDKAPRRLIPAPAPSLAAAC